MISAIIPIRNEDVELLTLVVSNLTEEVSPNELELVIVNDGSINQDGTHWDIVRELDFLSKGRNIVFINRHQQHGVGYSFDEGVKYATGDTIVLMGADVLPDKRSWLTDVKNNVKDNEIGCACSVGLQPGNYNIHAEKLYERYGAKILYTMTAEDLPKKSVLRNIPDYKEILESKWMPKESDEPYEIPCLLGAFYWTTKAFYQRIGGWDTISGKFFHGAQSWGCLEPHLSLKTRVYGGKCMMYPDIKVGHVFGRIEDKNLSKIRAIRADLKYWNKLWVAHTLLDDNLRDEVINFLSPSLNYGIAQVAIRHNWDAVKKIRNRNKRDGCLISK